jgi:cation diffusion facilitator family transporter
MSALDSALQLTGLTILINLLLSVIKITAGVSGHSYALIADGLESSIDVLGSVMVWGALRFSMQPADRNHPFGHGKAESLAGFLIALLLFLAAGLIAYRAIKEILQPHHAPLWFTLPILAGAIILKEFLFRRVSTSSEKIHSRAMKNDAWHHRSDALTSGAAFIGISIALIGGPNFYSADSWAALVACVIIAANGALLLGPSMNEVMDAAVPEETQEKIRNLAQQVKGVQAIEKCRIRKSGLAYYMDIHVQVNGDLTVSEGHEIAHRVKDYLQDSNFAIADVVVHIEPYSARSLEV